MILSNGAAEKLTLKPSPSEGKRTTLARKEFLGRWNLENNTKWEGKSLGEATMGIKIPIFRGAKRIQQSAIASNRQFYEDFNGAGAIENLNSYG